MELSGRIAHYMQNPYSAETRKQQVSRQIKDLRRQAGLTQREVCEIIQVTPQTYSGYENGKYEPTLETIVRLSLLYRVKADHILCIWTNEDEEAESTVENEIHNEEFRMLQEEVERLKIWKEEMEKHKSISE